MEFLTKKEVENGKGYASFNLREKVVKSNANEFLHIAFTDYGGTILDKIYFLYFKEKHQKNMLFEETCYYGANAFIFFEGLNITFEEFKDKFEDYILFFGNIEEFFYEYEFEEKRKACIEFIRDAVRFEEMKPARGCFEDVLNLFLEYSDLQTFGVDYSTHKIKRMCLDKSYFTQNN